MSESDQQAWRSDTSGAVSSGAFWIFKEAHGWLWEPEMGLLRGRENRPHCTLLTAGSSEPGPPCRFNWREDRKSGLGEGRVCIWPSVDGPNSRANSHKKNPFTSYRMQKLPWTFGQHLAFLYRVRVKPQPQEDDGGHHRRAAPHRQGDRLGRWAEKGRQLAAIVHLLYTRPVHKCSFFNLHHLPMRYALLAPFHKRGNRNHKRTGTLALLGSLSYAIRELGFQLGSEGCMASGVRSVPFRVDVNMTLERAEKNSGCCVGYTWVWAICWWACWGALCLPSRLQAFWGWGQATHHNCNGKSDIDYLLHDSMPGSMPRILHALLYLLLLVTLKGWDYNSHLMDKETRTERLSKSPKFTQLINGGGFKSRPTWLPFWIPWNSIWSTEPKGNKVLM